MPLIITPRDVMMGQPQKPQRGISVENMIGESAITYMDQFFHLYDQMDGFGFIGFIMQSATPQDPRMIIELRRSPQNLVPCCSTYASLPIVVWASVADAVLSGLEEVLNLYLVRWSPRGWEPCAPLSASEKSLAFFMAKRVSRSFEYYTTPVLYLCVQLASSRSYYTPQRPITYTPPVTPHKKVPSTPPQIGEIPRRDLSAEFDAEWTRTRQKEAVAEEEQVRAPVTPAPSLRLDGAAFDRQQQGWAARREQLLHKMAELGLSLTKAPTHVLQIIQEELNSIRRPYQDGEGAWRLSLLEHQCEALIEAAGCVARQYGAVPSSATECSGALKRCAHLATMVLSSAKQLLEGFRAKETKRVSDKDACSFHVLQLSLLVLQARTSRHVAVAVAVCGMDGSSYTKKEIRADLHCISSDLVTAFESALRHCDPFALRSSVLLGCLSLLEVISLFKFDLATRCHVLSNVTRIFTVWREATGSGLMPRLVEHICRQLEREGHGESRDAVQLVVQQVRLCARADKQKQQPHDADPTAAAAATVPSYGYTITQVESVAAADQTYKHDVSVICLLLELRTFLKKGSEENESPSHMRKL